MTAHGMDLDSVHPKSPPIRRDQLSAIPLMYNCVERSGVLPHVSFMLVSSTLPYYSPFLQLALFNYFSVS